MERISKWLLALMLGFAAVGFVLKYGLGHAFGIHMIFVAALIGLVNAFVPKS